MRIESGWPLCLRLEWAGDRVSSLRGRQLPLVHSILWLPCGTDQGWSWRNKSGLAPGEFWRSCLQEALKWLTVGTSVYVYSTPPWWTCQQRSLKKKNVIRQRKWSSWPWISGCLEICPICSGGQTNKTIVFLSTGRSGHIHLPRYALQLFPVLIMQMTPQQFPRNVISPISTSCPMSVCVCPSVIQQLIVYGQIKRANLLALQVK